MTDKNRKSNKINKNKKNNNSNKGVTFGGTAFIRKITSPFKGLKYV